MNLVSVQRTKCQTLSRTPNIRYIALQLNTNQQVLKNIIKLYWDARAMIISPPSAIGTTTTTENSNSLQQHV
jgi:hypothetical protein